MRDRAAHLGNNEWCLVGGLLLIHVFMSTDNFCVCMLGDEGGYVLDAPWYGQLRNVRFFTSGHFTHGHLFVVTGGTNYTWNKEKTSNE